MKRHFTHKLIDTHVEWRTHTYNITRHQTFSWQQARSFSWIRSRGPIKNILWCNWRPYLRRVSFLQMTRVFSIINNEYVLPPEVCKLLVPFPSLTFVGSCVWAQTSGERTCYWDAHSEESWELGDLVNHVTLLTPVWKNTGVITPTQVSLRQTQVSLLPVWYGWHLSKVTACLQTLALYSARETEKCGCHNREAWGNII